MAAELKITGSIAFAVLRGSQLVENCGLNWKQSQNIADVEWQVSIQYPSNPSLLTLPFSIYNVFLIPLPCPRVQSRQPRVQAPLYSTLLTAA